MLGQPTRAHSSPFTLTKLRPLGQESHTSPNPRSHVRPNGAIVFTSHSTEKKQAGNQSHVTASGPPRDLTASLPHLTSEH